jgi:aconitate hydratase 2/2-methylisocitrate dehydratase
MALATEMNLYKEYIKEIEERKGQGLHPKPIDSADLLNEIIAQIKDTNNANREDSLKFFIYNTLPGTTPAAGAKAKFLKEIILGQESSSRNYSNFCFELLSHMKGGPSIEVLLDLALGNDSSYCKASSGCFKNSSLSLRC